jgi:uncharacterized membrane protein YfcA
MTQVLGLAPEGLPLQQLGYLLAILAMAGFASGLAGFGFSAVGAAAVWVLPPVSAIPLLMALSIVNQAWSLGQLRKEALPLRQWWAEGPAPFIVAGAMGIPVGVWMLACMQAATLNAAVGLVLLAYTLSTLQSRARAPTMTVHAWMPLAVGFVGGVIGGFSAFPGSAVVVWASFIGVPRRRQRAIVQPYILAMQLISLSILCVVGGRNSSAGFLSAGFWTLFVIACPVVLVCTTLGVCAFRRVSDIDFKRITMALLALSGSALLVKGFFAL